MLNSSYETDILIMFSDPLHIKDQYKLEGVKYEEIIMELKEKLISTKK